LLPAILEGRDYYKLRPDEQSALFSVASNAWKRALNHQLNL